MAYEVHIGLEVHAELKTRTKMFCACRNDPNERHPNINVCPICLGHPGTLPVPNKEAIQLVQRVGAALGSELAQHAKFDRKNYFYPDLPKGYQISQYDMPFCTGGSVTLSSGSPVRIRRVHLEEDTGKLLHPEGQDYSIVDFNRAGVPLMEFVTEPDLRTAEDVALFAEELQRIFRYMEASDANMEKGEMRIELNVSLLLKSESRNPKSENSLGTKVEIKNLNSVRSAKLAVAYEIDRQSRLLEAGKLVVHETRGWHDTKQVTFSQRTKEEAHDYRYFPEPDIPPFHFVNAEFEKIRATVPELPEARRQRHIRDYGLSAKEIAVLVDDRALGDFFEHVVSEIEVGKPSTRERLVKLSANYILSDLRGLLVEHETSISDAETLNAEDFAELVRLVAQEKITSRVAKDVLREMFSMGRSPLQIIEEKGLVQVSDELALRSVVEKVIAENQKPVTDYREGKKGSLQFLVGKAMAATQGKANPTLLQKLFEEALR